jgi:hypothetical protein
MNYFVRQMPVAASGLLLLMAIGTARSKQESRCSNGTGVQRTFKGSCTKSFNPVLSHSRLV